MNPTLRMLAILLLTVSTTFAQRVSLQNDGQYRPGEYVPLVIEADGPGVVSIRAPESLGIDWDAPGKTSVTVPWMTWRETSGEMVLQVNQKPQTITLRRLGTGETYAGENPYAMPDNLAGPRVSGFGDAVYLPSYAWPGGLSTRTRWLIVAAAGVVALVLVAINLSIWRSRWTPGAVLLCGIVATVGVGFVPILNQPVSRAAAVVEPTSPLTQTDRYVYLRADRATRLSERWSAYTFLFPRSPAHLASLDPVVHLRPDTLAGEIEMTLSPRSTACILHRFVGVRPKFSGDEIDTHALVDRLY